MDADNRSISRTQFPLVLGWALTPWKAQGMTLDKVIVKLGASVSEPGVLFVALSRVRHPNDLMIDDDFPALFEILKQTKHPSYQKRQQWEKIMCAKFARTLREHMRDAEKYTHPGLHVWTAEDSDTADLLLRVVKQNPSELDRDTLLATAAALAPTILSANLARVWDRLQTFPYIFEIAVARGTLDTLTLQGTQRTTATSARGAALVTKIHYNGWHVALKDFADFRFQDKLSPALFEHFAQLFREHAPAHLTLSIQAYAKKHYFSVAPPAYSADNFAYVCYPYFSPVGYLTLYVLQYERRHIHDDPRLQLLVLQHADVFDDHTRQTTAHLRKCFPNAEVRHITLPKEQASDFGLLCAFAVASVSSELHLTNELLTDLRTAVLHYCEALEGIAATAHTPSLSDLLLHHVDLQEARRKCFQPVFGEARTTQTAKDTKPQPFEHLRQRLTKQAALRAAEQSATTSGSLPNSDLRYHPLLPPKKHLPQQKHRTYHRCLPIQKRHPQQAHPCHQLTPQVPRHHPLLPSQPQMPRSAPKQLRSVVLAILPASRLPTHC